MVNPDHKNKSTNKELRKYGLTMAVALAVICGLLFWRGREYYFWFLVIAAAFFVTSLAVPIVLRPLYKAWMTLAHLMGWLMTRVILFIAFFIVLTPTGLLMKLLGKDIIDIKFDAYGEGSYWKQKDLRKTEQSDYQKQF